jgi:hypothetical protein
MSPFILLPTGQYPITITKNGFYKTDVGPFDSGTPVGPVVKEDNTARSFLFDNYVGGDRSGSANGFIASSNYTVTSVKASLYRFGNGTHTVTAQIYSDLNGTASVAMGTPSTAVNVSTMITESFGTMIEFPNMNASLTSGSLYWMVLWFDHIDFSSYVNWRTTSATGKYNSVTPDMSSNGWSNLNGLYAGYYQILS